MDKNTQNTKKNLTNLTLSDKKRNFLKAFENKEFNISEACKAIKVSRQNYDGGENRCSNLINRYYASK